MNQTTIFDMMYPKYKITKPIRLIEMFAGYGSQALALKYLGVPFEHWKICEWAIKSIQAYHDIHFEHKYNTKNFYPKEFLVDKLYELGISSNYNEQMTKQQIERLSFEQLDKIWQNIIVTNNLVNIQQVKGEDLEIVDTDKYEYIMTYSFPCQDLSLAGKGKGMSDTSTRSGMLWEVERILTECKELGTLPSVLVMENVPQVHSTDNMPDFHKWQVRLEELGYKSYWQDLIATDFEIPQTRNRCFMVSILGNYSYTFPKPIPLKLKLKDMLEDNVDEKYYLSDKMKQYIFSEDDKYKVNKNSLKLNREVACSKTTREGRTRADTSDYIIDDVNVVGYIPQWHQRGYIYDEENSMTTICATDYKTPKLVKIKNATKKGYLEATDGVGGENNGVVVKPKVLDGIGEKKSNGGTQWYQQDRVYDDKIAISVTTDFNPYYKSDLRIRKLTPRECFRLMGVKDEDYEKCAKNQSDSSLYHLAGDSIVVNVLMAIFKELL